MKKLCSLRVLLPLLAAAFVPAASAAPIGVTALAGLGTITVTEVFSLADGALLGADIRGTSLGEVTDGLAPLGQVVFTDGGGNPPFGNTFLLAVNLPGLTDTMAIGFDFIHSALVGPTLVVTGTGTPIGTITDPAVSALAGPLDYTFTLTSFTAQPDAGQAVATFDLVGVVPEPSMVALSGAGLLGVLLLRRRSVAKSN